MLYLNRVKAIRFNLFGECIMNALLNLTNFMCGILLLVAGYLFGYYLLVEASSLTELAINGVVTPILLTICSVYTIGAVDFLR
jgi:hypothetical protein